MSNSLGAPAYVPNVKRFAAAIDALNGILKSEKQPATVKIRAVELLLNCYSVEYEGSASKRDLISVKQLLCDKTFETQLQRQIAAKLAAEDAEKASAEEDAEIQAIFHEAIHRPELDLMRRSKSAGRAEPEADMV